MNLFELQEKKEDIASDIRYYRREIERLETKTGVKAVDCSQLRVDGSRPLNSREEALLELTQMSIDLDDAMKKWDSIKILVNEKYANFKTHNSYDRQIYIEKKLFKWKNKKISLKHNGLSTSQIYNIVNKVEEVEKSGK